MGRLALIADVLGEKVIAAGIRTRMKAVLTPWLTGKNSNKLQYDPKWGGICSSASLADGGADFGNGQYNECVPSPSPLPPVLRLPRDRGEETPCMPCRPVQLHSSECVFTNIAKL